MLMKQKNFNGRIFLKAFICFSALFAQQFKHSIVMPVPDLSFHPSIFYGLDVLEQMDFKPLYGKTIGVFTNQTAVNRKGQHLLDLMKIHPKIDVKIQAPPIVDYLLSKIINLNYKVIKNMIQFTMPALLKSLVET